MIFVTVGTQLSFDRLISSMDAIAGQIETPVFSQIGPGKYTPANMGYSRFVSATSVEDHIKNASLVVAHAGMGTILTSLVHGKPIVIVPRLFEFGEHRNDHQLATAARFASREGVRVVLDIADLHSSVLGCLGNRSGHVIPRFAPEDFILKLKRVIND